MSVGWKTTEFWVALFTGIAATIAGLTSVLPANYAAIAVTVTAALYAAARAAAKYGIDIKRGYKTSEFYVAIFSSIGIVVAAIPGEVSATVASICAAILAGIYAVTRGLSKPTV
jgi:uncharacterized membrane protein HdeD (DUF308 family)